jgi:glycosyltransferase involved in cell wall biosynthesis
MNVLALASYPIEAAATRYRLSQFIEPLAQRGITLTIHPFINSQLFARLYSRGGMASKGAGFLSSTVVRLKDLLNATRADVVLIQREAMMFGPPIIEWLITRIIKRPMVLDLDDATYIPYTSPTYGGLGALKWFGKTDSLIKWANLVTCGNRAIAEYVTSKQVRASIIPTVVDTDLFRPPENGVQRKIPVVGWIGTHSTFPYLESVFPVLSELATHYDFLLKIVGSGKADIRIANVKIENLQWNMAREIEDFQSIDIGLYPIDARLYSGKWALGKSGFKAIQYMAVGVPYVATPVGGSAEIGEAGNTHFFASSAEEWRKALELLISDEHTRRKMGAAGRRHAVEHYNLAAQADKLAKALSIAASMKVGKPN